MSESYWEEEANSLEIQLSELQEKYEELEQQKAELIEALELSYKIMKSFSDKGNSAIAIQARKNKKLLLSLRSLKQEERDE